MDENDHHTGPNSADLKSILLAQGPSGLEYRPSTEEIQHVLLQHFIKNHGSILFLASPYLDAKDQFADILRKSKSLTCISDLVYGVSAVHLSSESQRFCHISTEYYVSAIAGLREMVAKKETDGTEEWLMTMIALLCLYEVR